MWHFPGQQFSVASVLGWLPQFVEDSPRSIKHVHFCTFQRGFNPPAFTPLGSHCEPKKALLALGNIVQVVALGLGACREPPSGFVFQRKGRAETEIGNWIQKYDTDMAEKQVSAPKRFVSPEVRHAGRLQMASWPRGSLHAERGQAVEGKVSPSWLRVREFSAALTSGKVTSTSQSLSLWAQMGRHILSHPPEQVFQFSFDPRSCGPSLASSHAPVPAVSHGGRAKRCRGSRLDAPGWERQRHPQPRPVAVLFLPCWRRWIKATGREVAADGER